MSIVPTRHPSPTAAPPGIDYFGRGHWLADIQARISVGVRRRMFEVWREAARGTSLGTRLLDVGTTPDVARLDSNCFVPWFHAAGLSITLYSPEPLEHLPAVFPYVKIWPSPGRSSGGRLPVRLPMPDRSYDWVVSSAVLEHVGNAGRQVNFIRECGRVGQGIFLTTPDRRHWLEFHTKLPFLHWLPKPWHRAALRFLKTPFWADEDNLNLLTKAELRALAMRALGNAFKVSVRSLWTLGMPSNLMLLATRRQRTHAG